MRSRLRVRPLLALLVALALAPLALGCGDDEGGGSPREAKALLERAFTKEVGSGELQLVVEADLEGGGDRLEKPIRLELGGPYKQGSRKELPRLDWDFVFSGAGLDVNGALIATDDNGYVKLQGQAYELGREEFDSLARQYSAAQPGRPQGLATFGLDPTTWLKDPELDGDGESVGGDPTRRVTSSVDVRKVARDIVELTRSPRLRRQLQSQGQPVPELPKPKDEDLDKIEDAIDEFDVQVDVDRKDVVRRFLADVDFDVAGDRGENELRGGRIKFTYVLTKVNTNPVIRAPRDTKPLGELLNGLGLGLLGGGLQTR